MANTVIQLKKSSTPTAQPADLANGEIAINYADGKLFYKDSTGIIQQISGGGNNFSTINAAGTLVVADLQNDILTLTNGNNIEITGDIINDVITITANLKSVYDTANAAYAVANAGGNLVPIFTVSNAAFDKANAANLLAYNTGIGANSWANTKLSNTNGVVFGGTLNISDSLYITNDITRVNSIFLNTTALAAANDQVVAGQLTWNPDDKTLDVGTGESILQVGMEQYYRVLNQSGQTIYNSNAVAYYGTVGNSGKLIVRRAIANNSYDSKNILGIATEDIPNGAEGFVTTFGKVRKIDTSMFSEGDILYVSATTPGALQNTKPSAPNNKVQIGTVITKSATVGMIFAAVQRGSSLADDELAHFNGSLVNGDLIRYVSANGRFENVNENSTGPATNASAAFDKANAANVLAYNTGIGANNYAGAMANAVNSYTSATYSTLTQLSSNWSAQNTTFDVANAAFGKANSANVLAKAAYDYANTIPSGATISATAPSSPTAGSLWWNTTYGKLLIYYNDGDTSQWVDAAPVPSSAKVDTSTTSPTVPFVGQLWWNSTYGKLLVYYNDGNSNQWVDAAPVPTSARIDTSNTTPTTPFTGQLWWNSEYGRLFVYYDDGDTTQWVDTNPATDMAAISNVANAAFNQANSGATYSYVNTSVAAANTWANTKLANTDVVLAGNLTSTQSVADRNGDLRNLPLNGQVAAYVLTLTDNGKVVSTNNNITVPNTIFFAGNTISVFNNSAANITISNASSVTMYSAGTANTGNRTLQQRGIATILCVAANTFVITGAGIVP